jgi:hypothetical protein
MDLNLQPGAPLSHAPAAYPGSAPAAGPHAEMMERLRAYVGPRWESHYRRTFEKLLMAQRGGASAPWTWNWSALFLAWFLYRRLYAAFAVFAAIRVFLLWPFIVASVTFIAGAPIERLLIRFVFGGALFFVMIVVQCWLADRLLFDRALAAAGAARDPARLSRAGKPMWWPIWVPVMLAFYLFAPGSSYFLFYYEPPPAPPKPVAAAPLPPPAQEVTSADGRIALTVPHHWQKMTGVDDDARIQVGNRAAEQYLLVRTESRDDLPRGVDAARHAETVVDGLRGRMKVESVSNPRTATVSRHRAVRYEVLGTEDGQRRMYFLTSIENERELHTVIAWTPLTGADSTRTTYREVLYSFREYLR